MNLALLAAAPAPAPARLPPEEQRVYLAPDDHTDYMWLLDEAGYEAAFVEMLDYYLAQIDATAHLPPEHQARRSCDGSLWPRACERRRDRDGLERLVGRIRDGHVSVPLNTLVSTYGGQPAEAVLRGMLLAGQIERCHGLRLPLALANESMTLPYGLGALWAGAGARYSWRGVCGCATQVADAGDRAHELYRWGSPDGSIIMKWNSLLEGASQHIGGYAEARRPADMVEYLSASPRFRALALRDEPGRGRGLGRRADAHHRARRGGPPEDHRRAARPGLQHHFFDDLGAAYGPKLPVQSLAFGNGWDLYSASLSEVSASVRRAVERLRTAEAMATLVSLEEPGFWDGRRAQRDEAMLALGLYWEHNWAADGRISKEARAAWQRPLARTITGYADALLEGAAAALGRLVRRGDAQAPRFLVFNALSFPRNDMVDLPHPGRVVDLAGGEELPARPVARGASADCACSRAVPPVGYRVLEVRPGAPTPLPPAATAQGGVLDGERYRLVLAARGARTSLVDKRTRRELAREIGGRALNDLGPGAGAIAVESVGPVSATLVASAQGPLRPRTRVTLYREVDRVDISNQIEQNFRDVRCWTFSFGVRAPDVWYEEVGAVIRARTASQGGRYTDRGARRDWLSLGHFVVLGGAGGGVALSSPDPAARSTPRTPTPSSPGPTRGCCSGRSSPPRTGSMRRVSSCGCGTSGVSRSSWRCGRTGRSARPGGSRTSRHAWASCR